VCLLTRGHIQYMYSWWRVGLSPETCRVKHLRRKNRNCCISLELFHYIVWTVCILCETHFFRIRRRFWFKQANKLSHQNPFVVSNTSCSLWTINCNNFRGSFSEKCYGIVTQWRPVHRMIPCSLNDSEVSWGLWSVCGAS